MGRLEKLFNVLHKNYASYRVKPNRPAQLPAGNYNEDVLTIFANDTVKAYNKFLLTQVFWAAAPKKHSQTSVPHGPNKAHRQRHLPDIFHGPQGETDKKEHRMNVINEDEQEGSP
jgi:hypothetical protein